MAFAVATTEWMVFRFERMLDDPLPFDFVEAAWAQIVDPHYALEWWDPVRDEEWVGPVKGPIREAVARVINIMRDIDETEEHPAEMCASLAKLTEHVLTDAAPYRAWRERVLERLHQLCQFDPADPLGDVVPRKRSTRAAVSAGSDRTARDSIPCRTECRGKRLPAVARGHARRGFRGHAHAFSASPKIVASEVKVTCADRRAKGALWFIAALLNAQPLPGPRCSGTRLFNTSAPPGDIGDSSWDMASTRTDQ
jgi:hypothetical protein